MSSSNGSGVLVKAVWYGRGFRAAGIEECRIVYGRLRMVGLVILRVFVRFMGELLARKPSIKENTVQ